MGTIKIKGGGLSGLVCGILLSKAGKDVEVYERDSVCGKKNEDFQYLENWTFSEDPMDYLKRIGIDSNFLCKKVNRLHMYGPSKEKYRAKTADPLMYAIKRGGKDSFDRSLEEQASSLGVKINKKTELDRKKAHVIATGSAKPDIFPMGIRFKTKKRRKVALILDNDLSDRFYSYFSCFDGNANIICVNYKRKDIKERLDKTIERFESILRIKVPKERMTISDHVGLGLPDTGKENGKLLVGEAAGFQDHLTCFGMIYSIKSAELAAKSIIEGKDYDVLWKRDFGKQLKISHNNRVFYDRLSNENYTKMISILKSKSSLYKMLRGGDDLRLILKRIYNNSFSFLLRQHII